MIAIRAERTRAGIALEDVAFARAWRSRIYKDAIRAWQKVVDIAPDSPEAMSAKESIGVLERVVQMKSTP